MAEYKDREHYIPIRRQDLLHLLCNDRGMTPDLADKFREFCEIVTATFHFEYHTLLEELKNEYAPFDPDESTKPIVPLAAGDRTRRLDNLFNRFAQLMAKANFKRLEHKVIEDAAKVSSDWGINMQVDWSIFERMDLYARGDSTGTRYRRRWTKFWKLESVQLDMYQRMVLIVKLRPSKRLPAGVDTEDVFLKIFKDIPKIDLEMLLPGARMQMPGSARLKLSSSFLSATALIAWNVGKYALAVGALSLQFFWGPLVAIFGYGYRQYHGYQSTRTAVNLRLTQSLYYQNLGNNFGVLFHLIDEAEEQECREAMLAYYYLWRFPRDGGWSEADLDDYIEMDLERLANVKVDFEVDDALAKLERLNLVAKNGNRYMAVPIDTALENLDRAWDNYFQHNKS